MKCRDLTKKTSDGGRLYVKSALLRVRRDSRLSPSALKPSPELKQGIFLVLSKSPPLLPLLLPSL